MAASEGNSTRMPRHRPPMMRTLFGRFARRGEEFRLEDFFMDTIGRMFGSRRKPSATPPPAPAEQRGGFLQRLRQKLNRGNSWLTYDLAELIPGGKIDDAVLEELETRLILADVGVETTEKILTGLRGKVARKELADLQALLKALREALLAILEPSQRPLAIGRGGGSGQNLARTERPRPFVILVVGVNGAGKTTTIGKLAHRFVQQRLKVMLAAGDTFRAAAVEQLQVWGERNSVAVVAQAEGADPAAVVFDAVQSAQARGIDVLLADTAGRLHTQTNLMEELKKIKRVITRLDPTAPHEVLLVLDAGQGQNALQQAQLFHEALGVSGLVLTKLDGTAKGGIVLAIADQLKLPIRYIGIGESAEDFAEFEAASFVDALLDPSSSPSSSSTPERSDARP
jgi:fused signal recognition particle receptor